MSGRGTGGGGLGGGSAANSPQKQRPGTAYGLSESTTPGRAPNPAADAYDGFKQGKAVQVDPSLTPG